MRPARGGGAGRRRVPGALAAAALAGDRQAIEARCAALQRAGGWIRTAGSEALADGTPSDRYRFVHPLHRAVLADRVPARRAACERRIGEWLEAQHATAPARVATALAHHFEAGRDADRAVRYRVLAARTATARHAHREAAAELTRWRWSSACPPPPRDATRRELLEQRGAAAARAATSTPRSRTSPRSSGRAAHRRGRRGGAGAPGAQHRLVIARAPAGSPSPPTWWRAAPTPRRRCSIAPAACTRTGGRASTGGAPEADAAEAAVAAMRAGGHASALAVHLGMHAFSATCAATTPRRGQRPRKR
jgi:hypothetical protein